jgi:hypothetical protein
LPQRPEIQPFTLERNPAAAADRAVQGSQPERRRGKGRIGCARVSRDSWRGQRQLQPRRPRASADGSRLRRTAR